MSLRRGVTLLLAIGSIALSAACSSTVSRTRFVSDGHGTTLSSATMYLGENGEPTIQLRATCSGKSCVPSDRVVVIVQLASNTMIHPIEVGFMMDDEWRLDLPVKHEHVRPGAVGYSYVIEAEATLGQLMSVSAQPAPRLAIFSREAGIFAEHKELITEFVDRIVSMRQESATQLASGAR
jgi:hypothetical protein